MKKKHHSIKSNQHEISFEPLMIKFEQKTILHRIVITFSIPNLRRSAIFVLNFVTCRPKFSRDIRQFSCDTDGDHHYSMHIISMPKTM